MSVEIIQGGFKSFVVRLRDAESGDPIDLSSATEIEVCLKNADDSDLKLNLSSGVTLVSGPLGKFQVSASGAQSALLKVQDNADMQVSYTISGNVFRTILQRAYSVKQSLC